MAVCELCGMVAKKREDVPGFKEFIHCAYCGQYFFNDQSGITPENKHLLAGYLFMQTNRKRQDNCPLINAHEMLNDIRIPTTPSKKLDYLLRVMGIISKGRIGVGFYTAVYYDDEEQIEEEYIQVDTNRELYLPPAIAYAVDLDEVSKMF